MREIVSMIPNREFKLSELSKINSSASEIDNTVSKLAQVALTPEQIAAKLTEVSGGISQDVLSKKADITVASINMFNSNDNNVVLGSFINAVNGNPTVSASYNGTGYIEVKPSTAYTLSYKHQIAWYDSNKVYISGSNSSDTNKTQTSPSNAKYLRCTVLLANWSTFQVEEGIVQTNYVPYDNTPILNYKIGKNTADIESLSFIKVGKNKFNKNKMTDLKYMGNNGTVATSTEYAYSDFIPVTAGEVYTTNKYLRFVTFYNSFKQVMTSVSIGANANTVPKDGENFTIPAGVSYMIITINRSNKDIQQIELGTVATSYSDYCYVYKDVPIKLVDANEEVDYIAIAPKHYICAGKETNFYIENMIKNFKKYSGYADMELAITPTRFKNTSVQTKIVDATGLVTPFNATVKVADDNYNTITQSVVSIEAVDMTKTNAITIANIGDSYTGRMAWANTILNETIPKTNLTFVGIRRANGSTIDCDGQGGWSLNSFFTVNGGGAFSQFMHPINGSYLYYGPTSFWIDANSATPSYNAGYFNTTKLLFNATTGLKITPTVNDVMFDGTNYINWNGTAWVTITEATLGGFKFNFSKYRTAWNIPTINLLHVLLGTNDFASATASTFDTSYAAFKLKYDELIASVKTSLPNCKIVVGIPVSSGKQGKYGTISSEKKKLNYWLLCRNLSRDYGGREAENIYLLDYHSQIDRVFGFDNELVKPFNTYDASFRDDEHLYKADNVHLSLEGYEQMGLAYMAMIQKLR